MDGDFVKTILEPENRFRIWDIIFILALTSLGAAIRYFVLTFTHHLDYDSSFCVIDAIKYSGNPYRLLEIPGLAGGGAGGAKGFYFLNALLIHWGGEPVRTAKMAALIPGILVFAPYYLWLRVAFGRVAAFGATFALAIYLPHVAISAAPNGFAGMIFFLALGGFFVEKTASAEESRFIWLWLFSAALATAGATTFRVEGWLLPFLFAWRLQPRLGLKKTAIFFLLASGYVIYQLYLNTAQPGGMFGFFQSAYVSPHNLLNTSPVAGRPFTHLRSPWLVWLQMLREQMTAPVLVLCFVGAGLGIFRKVKDRVFAAGFLATLIVLNARGLVSGQTTYERYTVAIGIFALPLAFVAMAWIIAEALPPRRRYRLAGYAAALGMIGLMSWKFPEALQKRIDCMQLNESEWALADWVVRDASPGDLYVVDMDEVIAYGFAKRTLSARPTEQYRPILEHYAPNDETAESFLEEGTQMFLLGEPGKPVSAKRIRVFKILCDEDDCVKNFVSHGYRYLFNNGVYAIFAPPWQLENIDQ